MNWRERKCVNVTKHCIVGKTSYAWAKRGDLWVSSESDVIPSLWQYVVNRNQERAFWSSIANALPDSARFTDTTRALTAVAGGNFPPRTSTRTGIACRYGEVILFAGAGRKSVKIFGPDGSCVFRFDGSDEALALPSSMRGNGFFIVRIERASSTETVRFASVR